MTQNVKSLDDLETGIKQLLLEDRCSFSDEEKVLLNECVDVLHRTKKSLNFDLLVKVLEILSKLFIIGIHWKDIL